jgi:antitoxin component YwqK of YwqJK toxin-antitoxin module
MAAAVTSAAAAEEKPLCYICYDPSTIAEPFLQPSPCACSGSIHLHYSCFLKIQQHNRAASCSICKRPYSEVSTTEDYEEIVEEDGTHYRVTGTRCRLTGKKDGLTVYYYSDGGHKRCVEYKNDEREGMFEEYYESGILAIKGRYYKNNRYDLFKEYYPSGELRLEAYYRDGKLHGEYTEYYESNKMKSACQYSRGTRYGLGCEYYENGIQSSLVEYDENGKKTGTEYQHYSDGILKANILWEDGKKVNVMEFYDEPGALKKADLGYNKDGQLIFEKRMRPDGIVYQLLENGVKPSKTMIYLYTMADKGCKLEH